MGLCPGKPDHPRRGARPRGRYHRGKAPPHLRGGAVRGWLAGCLILLAAALAADPLRADPSPSDRFRIVFWHTEQAARGPGLFLDALLSGDPGPMAVAEVLAGLSPDVAVLAGIDHDRGGAALAALGGAVTSSGGPDGLHTFTALPNAGMQTGLDLDGDGRLGGPGDAQGYGRFAGQGGLAVISRWPVDLIEDHSARLWRDMPDTLMVDAQGREGAQATGAGIQRLSSTAHWELRVTPPRGKPITLMIFHATPPVFDGPEDRNGRRNHDEVIFWKHRLDGAFGPAPDPPYVIAGAANLDPSGGDGRGAAIRALLTDPRLRDPPGLTGKATVDWPDPGPGRLRVDYLLPSAGLILTGSGLARNVPASRHRAIWIDIDLQAATAPPD